MVIISRDNEHRGESMKKIRLFYNPIAGDRSFRNSLDNVIESFQAYKLQVVPYRLEGAKIPPAAFAGLNAEDYHSIVAAGGDGTLHQVVNAMVENNIDLPLGIMPAGTSNDFAAYLNLPRNFEACCKIIAEGVPVPVDLGTVNGINFVNVIGGGLLVDVPQKTDLNLKSILGKLAYYLKGLEQLPNFRPFKVQINSLGKSINDSVFLFLVLNSSVAGGFAKVAPDAKIDDGKLDVLVIKSCSLPEIVSIFIKLLRGEHLNSPYLDYFQTDEVIISSEQVIETDVDGEAGPDFPLYIKVKQNKLKVFM